MLHEFATASTSVGSQDLSLMCLMPGFKPDVPDARFKSSGFPEPI